MIRWALCLGIPVILLAVGIIFVLYRDKRLNEEVSQDILYKEVCGVRIGVLLHFTFPLAVVRLYPTFIVISAIPKYLIHWSEIQGVVLERELSVMRGVRLLHRAIDVDDILIFSRNPVRLRERILECSNLSVELGR